MKKKIIIAITITIIIGGFVLLSSKTPAPSEIPIDVRDFDSKAIPVTFNKKIMMPLLNSENPLEDFSKMKKYLRTGDTIIYNPANYKQISLIKNELNGILLGTGGTSINNLKGNICRIPDDTKIVTYDYEPDFTPEYTSDQEKAIEFFSELKIEANSCGKKLAIAPAFVFTSHWDWTEVSKHTDIIIMQVQNFQTNAQVPEKFKPSSLGVNLIQVTRYLTSEINPETELYLQFGSVLGSRTGSEIASDMELVSSTDIDGVVLWYNAGLSGNTSNIEPILEALNEIR